MPQAILFNKVIAFFWNNKINRIQNKQRKFNMAQIRGSGMFCSCMIFFGNVIFKNSSSINLYPFEINNIFVAYFPMRISAHKYSKNNDAWRCKFRFVKKCLKYLHKTKNSSKFAAVY
jgi:hypothetical protein